MSTSTISGKSGAAPESACKRQAIGLKGDQFVPACSGHAQFWQREIPNPGKPSVPGKLAQLIPLLDPVSGTWVA